MLLCRSHVLQEELHRYACGLDQWAKTVKQKLDQKRGAGRITGTDAESRFGLEENGRKTSPAFIIEAPPGAERPSGGGFPCAAAGWISAILIP